MALLPGSRRCMALLGPPGPQALHGPPPSLVQCSHQPFVMRALWTATSLGAGSIAVTRTAEGLLPGANIGGGGVGRPKGNGRK